MERGNGNTVLLTVIGVATLLVALVGATFAYFTATANSESSQSISIVTATPASLVVTSTATPQLINAVPTPGEDASKNVVYSVNLPENSTSDQSYDVKLSVDSNTFNMLTAAGAAGEGNQYTDQLELKIVQATSVSSATYLVSPLSMATTAVDAMTSEQLTATATLGDASGIHSTRTTPGANTVIYNVTGYAVAAGEAAVTKIIVNDQVIHPGETQTYTMNLWFRETGVDQTQNSGSKTFVGHLQVEDVKALASKTLAPAGE